jgi:hypothetical protein
MAGAVMSDAAIHMGSFTFNSGDGIGFYKDGTVVVGTATDMLDGTHEYTFTMTPSEMRLLSEELGALASNVERYLHRVSARKFCKLCKIASYQMVAVRNKNDVCVFKTINTIESADELECDKDFICAVAIKPEDYDKLENNDRIVRGSWTRSNWSMGQGNLYSLTTTLKAAGKDR